MHTKLMSRPVDQAIAAIQALDLGPIKLKLLDPEEGHGWSREYADRMELAYKRFLILSITHPKETLAPSKDVDRFWHGHILDTLKYAEDCEKVFGYFLHHFPYFGMRGAEDAANLAEAAENTKRLYRQEFGSAQAWSGGTIKAETAAYCGGIRAETAAYCGEIRAETAAYCGEIRAETAAYCGEIKGETAAYCGEITNENPFQGEAVRHASDKLNVSARPSLPAAV